MQHAEPNNHKVMTNHERTLRSPFVQKSVATKTTWRHNAPMAMSASWPRSCNMFVMPNEMAEMLDSSESKCYLRVVIFWRGPSAGKKRDSIAQRVFREALQKDDTCLTLYCCAWGHCTSVMFMRVRSEVPRGLPGTHKILALKGHSESGTWTRYMDQQEALMGPHKMKCLDRR